MQSDQEPGTDQEKGSGKRLLMTSGLRICSQERRTWRARRGSNEKGKKKLTKGHGNRVKGSKAVKGQCCSNLFPHL